MQTVKPSVDKMNEAIAEFMELEKDVNTWRHPYGATVYLLNGYWYSVAKLQYHSDWKSLMPVWFKCQNIGADMGSGHSKFYLAFHVGIDQQDILACHRTVYDFIVWYNQQKKQS